jgi:hypothetical protein
VGLSGVSGIGIGSIHSSSSRSDESDDIVREKSTAVGLLLCGRVLSPALGVTGPTGSSLVVGRFSSELRSGLELDQTGR